LVKSGRLQQLEKPKVSIIVPVYNIENFLAECLDSVLSQTFTEFECILVDDCSTDTCSNICDDYALKDRRVKVIHNIENVGSSISRKVGMDNCCGEYILYIDGDDFVEKDMIEKMYIKAKSGNFDMVICEYYYEKHGERIYIKQDIEKMNKMDILKDIIVLKKLAAAVWNKFIKRDILAKIQFPKINYSEDRFINVQTLYYSEKIGFIGEALYHYRYNQNSISFSQQGKDKRIVEFFDSYVLIIKFLNDKYGTDLIFFEPELSSRINNIKISLLTNKHLRKSRKFNSLYPQANKHIFGKTFNANLIKKISLFIFVRNLLLGFLIIYIFDIIKNVYKIMFSGVKYYHEKNKRKTETIYSKEN
jgi:glycosyltransferase involved in cell wall biosynthesis